MTAAAAALAPQQSREQKLANLQLANDTRSRRSTLKRDLKSSRVALLPLLMNPPADLHTMKAMDLLMAAPKIGRVKANKALSRAGVSPTKTLGGVSERQRRELVNYLIRTGRTQ